MSLLVRLSTDPGALLVRDTDDPFALAVTESTSPLALRVQESTSPLAQRVRGLFSPSQLPGLAAWYDAADSSTVLTTVGPDVPATNGQTVRRWLDKSGNGRHLDQATLANQPAFTNTATGLTFDGNDFLNGGDILDLGTNDVTAFCVFTKTTTGESFLFGKARALNTAGRWGMIPTTTQNNSMIYFPTTATVINTVTANITTARKVGALRTVRSAGTRQAFLNTTAGTLDTFTPESTNHNTDNLFMVGAYPGSDPPYIPPFGLTLVGTITEIIVCLTSLSDSDMEKARAYLTRKWSIVV
jgi:hypothetical protein